MKFSRLNVYMSHVPVYMLLYSTILIKERENITNLYLWLQLLSPWWHGVAKGDLELCAEVLSLSDLEWCVEVTW